jgi:hypothetical protein
MDHRRSTIVDHRYWGLDLRRRFFQPITAAKGGGFSTPRLEGAPLPVPAGKVSCATQLPH